MNRFYKLINSFKALGLVFLLAPSLGFGQIAVFGDDVISNTNATYTTSGAIGSSSWTVSRPAADFGARRNTSPTQLELTNDVGATTNVAGWVLASTSSTSFATPYNTTLSSNPGLVTWTFNMRQVRTDPAGFSAGAYGAAFILAGTSTTNNNTGSGYAVALGQSGTTDPVRLIKYSNGIQGTLTNIISSNTAGLLDFGADYLSVKVTFTPSTNTWELFLRNDGLSTFVDPTTGTVTSQGTAVDNTNTGTALALMGAWWQGSTGAAQTAFFNNFKVTVTCPTTSTALTSTNWTTASTWVCGTVPTTTSNVAIPTGVTVTLDAAATINDITFTGGGKLLLGANTLTVNGLATGDAVAGHVVTDGTGALTQTLTGGAIAKTFPIGVNSTSYDPVTITLTGAGDATFGANVKGALTNPLGTNPATSGAVVNREWNLTRTGANTSPTNLAFTTTALTIDGSSTRPTAAGIVGHWNGSVWEDYAATYAANVWTVNNYSGTFSPFIVATPAAVLSVEWQKVSAQAKGNSNLVAWSTASEKNSQSFDIQHATNALDFVTVGNVKAKGTANVESNYSFIHATPAIGTNYYRLKQMDANGTESFSKIVSVQNGGKKAPLLVYPTLATDVLHVLTNSDKNEDFQIVNTLGQIMLSGRISNGADININALANGHYILKTAGESARFVKN